MLSGIICDRLDKALFQELATGRWIKEKRNLLILDDWGRNV